MKKVLIVLFIVVLSLMTISFFSPDKVIAPTNPEIQNKNQISIRGVKISVEIADDPLEQSHGLSGREFLAPDAGMLFIFPQPLIPSFWMKDMKFSLDFIWIDEGEKIIEITKNVSPTDYPQTYHPSSQIKYVLEVNAGWADRNNIEVGDKVIRL